MPWMQYDIQKLCSPQLAQEVLKENTWLSLSHFYFESMTFNVEG